MSRIDEKLCLQFLSTKLYPIMMQYLKSIYIDIQYLIKRSDCKYKWQLNQISLKVKELKIHCHQIILNKKLSNDLGELISQMNMVNA